MEYVDGILELGHVHRAVCPASIICSNLPHLLAEPMQHFCAFMLLPDLRLIERETELLPDCRRETPQGGERIDQPY